MPKSIEDAIKFYNIPNNVCSCRDEFGNPVKIGREYKEFFEKLKEGVRGADALDEMKIMKTCCRIKLLCLATEPMIDRSKERFIDNTVFPPVITNTRELKPLINPPNFPEI